MPRRVVGSANYGLYASLTKGTEEAFLCLLAIIIYDVSTDELSGELRPVGIDTRRKRLGQYQLTAKVWLTDTVIAVQATAFTGPDGDDDDDDRNDAHEICEFEFERERGHWRIVQVSGAPLPTPETVGRIAASAGEPIDCGMTPRSAGVAARLTANVGSTLRSLLAATGSYLRRGRARADSSRSLADFYVAEFISYSSTASIIGSRPRFHSSFAASASGNRPGEIRLAYRISIAVLTANDVIEITRIQITGTTLQNTARAALILLGRNGPLMITLAERNAQPDIIVRAILETFGRSPSRARRLLSNLLDLGTAGSAAPTLRKTNRAAWNSLIVRPLQKICANPNNSRQLDPLTAKSANAANATKSARPKPMASSLIKAHANPTPSNSRRVPRQAGHAADLP